MDDTGQVKSSRSSWTTGHETGTREDDAADSERQSEDNSQRREHKRQSGGETQAAKSNRPGWLLGEKPQAEGSAGRLSRWDTVHADLNHEGRWSGWVGEGGRGWWDVSHFLGLTRV